MTLHWADLAATVGQRPGDHIHESAAGQTTPPKPPSFTFGPVPAELNRFYYNETVIYPVATASLREAGVTGDAFPVRDGACLTAAAYGLSPDYIAMRLGGAMPRHHRREQGRAICLSAPGYLIYGHWLVDILPKLHLLELLGIDLSRETLVMPADTPRFGYDWLSLLGVRPNRIVTYDPRHEIVTFDELILPFQLRASSRASALFAPATRTLLRRMGPALSTPNPVASDRIYVSRQRSGRTGRVLLDALALEGIAQAYGYTVVYPEAHSLPEQIAMFRAARFLVGEYGSALHGSMFAGPECVVCAIRGTGTDPGFLQSGLCEVMNQRLGYVFGHSSQAPGGPATVDVDPEDLRSALHIMNLLANH